MKTIQIAKLAFIVLISHCLHAQQNGSYKDNFQYIAPPANADSNSFNNWFWEIYPKKYPADSWVKFSFHVPTNDRGGTTCSQLTIKSNAPKISGNHNQPYQDAEIFNNACITGGNQGTYMQPSCDSIFPSKRLNNTSAPYPMQGSSARAGAMYVANNGTDVNKNSPYYPSANVAYGIKMRVKAEGVTFGTRGWGFWNTGWPPGSADDRFAWFYEWGINFNFSSDTATSPNVNIPLVFPTALTCNGDSLYATLLIADFYAWHDYEVIWSNGLIEYFIDDVLVARHHAAPAADSTHGMAYHNWVDNRLFFSGPEKDKNPYVPVRLPCDKSNYTDYFEARPIPGYVPSTANPLFGALTVSFSVKQGMSSIRSRIKDLYLEQLEKQKKKK